jgi:hypothetical protein
VRIWVRWLLACTCFTAISLLFATDGYNLVEVQQGSALTALEVAFGPKIPTDPAVKDVHNWSVRVFDL